MELSSRLQELRKEAGYSQEQLAEMLGVSRQAVSKWESGQTNPDINNVGRLSEIYDRSTDYIIFGEEREPEIVYRDKIVYQDKIIYQEKKAFQKLNDLPRSAQISLAITVCALGICAAPALCLLLLYLISYLP